MPVSDDVLLVGGGRRVGYRLFGAEARPGLLFMHGSLGSRAEVGHYDLNLLEERGVCAVALDRPGYGATDALDDLDLLARTKDAVAVAGHLGMARFAVQGTSGGGPYALACAVLMPDRIQAVILASALGRVGNEGDLDLLPEDVAEEWRQEWRDPEGARDRLEVEAAELRAEPLASLRQLTSDWPAEERNWLEEHRGACRRCSPSCAQINQNGWEENMTTAGSKSSIIATSRSSHDSNPTWASIVAA
jgi:pimeloyl-ACP methyl ester carboxylesterase